MKHILGMAKSHLDFKGAKSPKLELDYLRLVYAITAMRKQGDNAQGYFVVMADEMLSRISKWECNYRGKEYVEVVSASLNGHVSHTLENNKTVNLTRVVVSTIWDKSADRSITNVGRDIGEGILTEIIERLEPNVQRVRDENRFPLGIRWDFYGVVG